MTYLPNHFSIQDSEQVRDLVQQNPFATLLSFPMNEDVFINHLPLMWSSEKDEKDILIGHMAKMNPQWKHFQNNPKAKIIFQGPHAYITPKWYTSGRDVPTWNYAVVHFSGKMELVESFEGQMKILKQLSVFFESGSENPWEFDLPEDLKTEKMLTGAIISFRFNIEKVEAKFKMSQNRPQQDRQGVIAGLSERTDEMSALVREIMLKNEIGRKT